MPLLTTGVGAYRAIGGGGYTGPGDINGAASAWWGLRAFSAAYAAPGTNPAVDLVDQAGANPITINILASGSLDIASINTWVTANTVTTIKITKLYDQSGSARHFSNATLAQMPVLTLNATGSLPGITVSSASTIFSTAATTGPAQTFTISYAAKRTSATTLSDVFGANGGIQLGFDAANSAGIYAGLGPVDLAGVTDNSFHAVQNIFAGASSTISADGTTSGSLNPGTNDLTASVVWSMASANPSGSNPMSGVILELGIWAGNQSGNTSTMNSNQHTYWGF